MSTKKLILTPAAAKKLQRLHDVPEALYCVGEANFERIIGRPCIGVVGGTRKPTAYGQAITRQITAELTRAGITIISGLAIGVDSIAHSSCLSEKGATIAVLPSGIETVYPASHRHIARDITQNGALISEYSGDSLPRKDQFIARNRIIAALADGLVIPEAAERSGSLHTANFALDIGIPVFAAPGPITSSLSAGTNQLITQGATPLLSAATVLQALGFSSQKASHYEPQSEHEARILEALTSGLTDGAQIKQASELETTIYLQTLTLLEIKGVVRALGGDCWSL